MCLDRIGAIFPRHLLSKVQTLQSVQKYETVFKAFAEGTIVMEKGMPTTFIPETEDIIGELEDALEEDEPVCEVTDITTTDVYKFLVPAKATA
jgi:ArsR family metal-binding transcriptional regulator